MHGLETADDAHKLQTMLAECRHGSPASSHDASAPATGGSPCPATPPKKRLKRHESQISQASAGSAITLGALAVSSVESGSLDNDIAELEDFEI